MTYVIEINDELAEIAKAKIQLRKEQEKLRIMREAQAAEARRRFEEAKKKKEEEERRARRRRQQQQQRNKPWGTYPNVMPPQYKR